MWLDHEAIQLLNALIIFMLIATYLIISTAFLIASFPFILFYKLIRYLLLRMDKGDFASRLDQTNLINLLGMMLFFIILFFPFYFSSMLFHVNKWNWIFIKSQLNRN